MNIIQSTEFWQSCGHIVGETTYNSNYEITSSGTYKYKILVKEFLYSGFGNCFRTIRLRAIAHASRCKCKCFINQDVSNAI